MKHNCPHWDEKKHSCKLMDIVEDLSRSNALLAQTVEVYAPQKISLGPIPGSHGMAEGSSPIPQPPNAMLESLSKIGSQVFHPPTDSQPAHFEELEKKQEYWEKELEKMDEEKKGEK